MQPNFYAVLPAYVRYAKITPNAKLLWAEISALSNKEGFCWATNKYFAEVFDISADSVSRLIAELASHGLVVVEIDKMAGNKRKLWGVPAKMPGGLGKNADPSFNNIINKRDGNKFPSSSEITEVRVDSEGNEKPPKPKRTRGPEWSLREKLYDRLQQETGVRPSTNAGDLVRIQAALKHLTPEQVLEMFEDAVVIGKVVTIRGVFTDRKIDEFRMDNV